MLRRILVVGRGPVGLTVATLLARAGIRCHLVEKRHQPSLHSKALSLAPATLDVLAEAGAGDEVRAAGTPATAFGIWYEGAPIGEVRFDGVDAPIRHFTQVPQWVTEAALARTLASAGGSVDAGCELVGLREDGETIVAALLGGDGRRREHRYDLVVGADGVHSSVRRWCEIGLAEGGPRDLGFNLQLCDVPFEWDGPRHQVTYFVDDIGFAIVLPLDGTMCRLVSGHLASGSVGPHWPVERFASELARLGVPGFRCGPAAWTSSARPLQQLAARFAQGRVALAGDACHAFSPIGGQGLNTGMQDARRLARALIDVTGGASLDDALAAYDAERRSAARSVATWTGALTELILRRDRDPHGLLGHFLPRSRGNPFLATILPSWLCGVRVSSPSAVAPQLL